MPDWSTISDVLESRPNGDPEPVHGGCIHSSWRWGPYFIKTNTRNQFDNLRAEASGLKAIHASGAIRVPEVIVSGQTANEAYLVLEHLDLTSSGNEQLLGEQLAALHGDTADLYGFSEDNYIGATTQPNPWTEHWPSFFANHRLGHLLQLLESKGVSFRDAPLLLDRLPELLPDTPPASLLHGDLWGGNKAFLRDGTPVLFDPACHHGHAECDLAMTTLFGGFSPRFYDAYHAIAPQEPGHQTRLECYRLYHVLNHALLFDGGYVPQAEGMIRNLAHR